LRPQLTSLGSSSKVTHISLVYSVVLYISSGLLITRKYETAKETKIPQSDVIRASEQRYPSGELADTADEDDESDENADTADEDDESDDKAAGDDYLEVADTPHKK
jgi:hypothetical protein